MACNRLRERKGMVSFPVARTVMLRRLATLPEWKGFFMNVLVVGGAGYIGSHCVRQLQEAGHRPVVLDNLVFGHRAAVAADVAFYDGELGDEEAVGSILRREAIEVVMHFAAFTYVGESVT